MMTRGPYRARGVELRASLGACVRECADSTTRGPRRATDVTWMRSMIRSRSIDIHRDRCRDRSIAIDSRSRRGCDRSSDRVGVPSGCARAWSRSVDVHNPHEGGTTPPKSAPVCGMGESRRDIVRRSRPVRFARDRCRASMDDARDRCVRGVDDDDDACVREARH